MESMLFLSPRVGFVMSLVMLEILALAAQAQEVALPAELGVFPNPAHIRATVQVPAMLDATRATVTLTDAQGTVVFEQPVSLTEAGGTTEVPLLGREPGLYRVVVQAGDQRVARTLKVE